MMSAVATQKPPRKKRKVLRAILAIILIVIAVSAVIGVFSQPKNAPVSTTSGSLATNSTTSKAADLELLDNDWEHDGYLRYAVGHIRNNTNKTYRYVQISINLYENETQVGSTLANVNNLEPGATWEFKALVTADNATSYKITEITGF